MTVPTHDLLAARPGEGVEDLRRGAFALDFTYALRLPDGAVRRFALHIQTQGEGRVSVREADDARQLPVACPERHINQDGSFCLGLPEDAPDITTAAGVDQWWRELAGYLSLQVLAETTRQWPVAKAWRHGGAARPQRALEELLAGAPWVGTCSFAVLRNGRVVGRRAPCPCGSGTAVRHCHEDLLVRAGDLRRRIAEGEADYYRSWRAPCCGTMAECGVKSGIDGRTR